MSNLWTTAAFGLGIMLMMGFVTWIYSLARNNVNIVDSLWSLMFLAGAVCYAAMANNFSAASLLLLTLVAVWLYATGVKKRTGATVKYAPTTSLTLVSRAFTSSLVCRQFLPGSSRYRC